MRGGAPEVGPGLRQEREINEMDRHYRGLERLEKREDRSAATAAVREGYRKLRVRGFELKPEFDKALIRRDTGDAGGSDARRFSALFTRLAGGVGFTKGDLQAAFERAHAGKTKPPGDSGTKSPDPEKLEQARRLREELEEREPRPGPDRDRGQ